MCLCVHLRQQQHLKDDTTCQFSHSHVQFHDPWNAHWHANKIANVVVLLVFEMMLEFCIAFHSSLHRQFHWTCFQACSQTDFFNRWDNSFFLSLCVSRAHHPQVIGSTKSVKGKLLSWFQCSKHAVTAISRHIQSKVELDISLCLMSLSWCKRGSAKQLKLDKSPPFASGTRTKKSFTPRWRFGFVTQLQKPNDSIIATCVPHVSFCIDGNICFQECHLCCWTWFIEIPFFLLVLPAVWEN